MNVEISQMFLLSIHPVCCNLPWSVCTAAASRRVALFRVNVVVVVARFLFKGLFAAGSEHSYIQVVVLLRQPLDKCAVFHQMIYNYIPKDAAGRRSTYTLCER